MPRRSRSTRLRGSAIPPSSFTDQLSLLVCATDFDIVAAGGSDISLTRDLRYRFAPRA